MALEEVVHGMAISVPSLEQAAQAAHGKKPVVLHVEPETQGTIRPISTALSARAKMRKSLRAPAKRLPLIESPLQPMRREEDAADGCAMVVVEAKASKPSRKADSMKGEAEGEYVSATWCHVESQAERTAESVMRRIRWI